MMNLITTRNNTRFRAKITREIHGEVQYWQFLAECVILLPLKVDSAVESYEAFVPEKTKISYFFLLEIISGI